MSFGTTTRWIGAMGGLFVLVGCPIPQSVPEVASTEGGTSPPRIVADSIDPPETIIPVSLDCVSVAFSLKATLVDEKTDDLVEARWFLDYDASLSPNRDPVLTSSLPPPSPESTLRPVPGYVFSPSLDDSWTVHVVELVVSNGFYAAGTEPADVALPNRTAQDGYETQVFRWVFLSVPSGGRCN